MELLILVLLILLNGVFRAVRDGDRFFPSSPRLKAMADRGNGGAKTALRLLDDPSKLLSTVQIGITAIGVIAGAYSATALSDDLTPIVASWHPMLGPTSPS
jgi:putative hemolysin